MISIKMYETFHIDASSIVAMNKSITIQHVLDAEIEMLNTLNFKLRVVSVFDIIDLFLSHIYEGLEFHDNKLYSMCALCTDMTLFHPDLLNSNVKLLACGIIACSSALITKSPNNSKALISTCTFLIIHYILLDT
ncbi:G2/mitotic-specific cyclin [Acrasis kona]|uniref:Cig2 n=1 Tax=Acrasis kona TaxID=1008807 RepID=A0AAW2Z2L9_9EUKA